MRVCAQVWMFKGKRGEDEMYRGMWERAMDEMLARLLFRNEESGYTYVAEFSRCAARRCCLLCAAYKPGSLDWSLHVSGVVWCPGARAACCCAQRLRLLLLPCTGHLRCGAPPVCWV
jgi:hypothetical protein